MTEKTKKKLITIKPSIEKKLDEVSKEINGGNHSGCITHLILKEHKKIFKNHKE